ncbi:MAG: hypothetical protein Q9192_003961 [Flavoplaca navasiana]
MREDPPPDARCRDKFLVQTVALSQDSDASNIPAIVCSTNALLISLAYSLKWQNIEKVSKSSIQERKIRVVFLPADGSGVTPSQRAPQEAHTGDEAPPAYGSPAPSFGSPGPEAVTPMNRSTDNQARMESTGTHSAIPNNQSTTSAAASNIAQAVSASGEDLRAQLADAKATISRLTQQAEEQGLRQRKTDAVNQDSRERITTGTTGMGIQQQPADGVPVQIVAALCLLSFLFAYFLF